MRSIMCPSLFPSFLGIVLFMQICMDLDYIHVNDQTKSFFVDPKISEWAVKKTLSVSNQENLSYRFIEIHKKWQYKDLSELCE